MLETVLLLPMELSGTELGSESHIKMSMQELDFNFDEKIKEPRLVGPKHYLQKSSTELTIFCNLYFSCLLTSLFKFSLLKWSLKCFAKPGYR